MWKHDVEEGYTINYAGLVPWPSLELICEEVVAAQGWKKEYLTCFRETGDVRQR